MHPKFQPTMFFLYGAPGSGKSTFVAENQLEPFTVSPDEIRRMFAVEVSATDGGSAPLLSGRVHRRVFQLAEEIAETKAFRGATIVIDAMNINPRSIKPFISVAKAHGYRTVGIDFNKNITLDELIERNLKREPMRRVDQDVLANKKSQADRYTTKHMFDKFITPDEFINTANEMYDIETHEYYDHPVVVVGDIQSEYEPLRALHEDYPDARFIYIGDLFDRGPEPLSVANTVESGIIFGDDIFVMGNHDTNMTKIIRTDISTNKWVQTWHTRQQLNAGGWNDNRIMRLMDHYTPFHIFKTHPNGPKWYATHSGLAARNFDTDPWRTSEWEYTHGVSDRNLAYSGASTYTDYQEGVMEYSIFGHRGQEAPESTDDNIIYLDNKPNTYCLESRVETGGWLSALLLEGNNEPKLVRY